MEERSFDRLYGRSVTLDFCNTCQAIWFDDLELLQLTPGATLRLVTSLKDRLSPARTPLGTRLPCPRCKATLVESNDLQRNTRFSYVRCPAGHGRFLTFYQFLRAKNFVRSLDAREIADLRRHIRQINCANCGAPVEVERHAACTFCRSPIAMLDPDQVRKAVAELQQADARRQRFDPTLPVQLLAERAKVERAFAMGAQDFSFFHILEHDRPANLIEAGLSAFGRWLAGQGD
jgi:hypothetical protein